MIRASGPVHVSAHSAVVNGSVHGPFDSCKCPTYKSFEWGHAWSNEAKSEIDATGLELSITLLIRVQPNVLKCVSIDFFLVDSI